MHVLSLFDWISCGRLALERAWIQVDKYFASEVDKYAIEIAKKNYPDTIHIGSVTDVHYYQGELQFPDNIDERAVFAYAYPIDMIIWWSPCQDLSIAKKDWKGLQGEKSSLFFEYVRLLKEVKPKYFLLENVASMKKGDRDKITEILWVEPIMINSALLSAQNRKRLYWFWQNRKREYNKDILCKHCFYEKWGIQTETSWERSPEILGNSQKWHSNMQDMLKGIFEDWKKMNSKDLQWGVCESKQESKWQSISPEKQKESTWSSKGVQEDWAVETMEWRVQENWQMQRVNEKSWCKTWEKNNESYEDSRTSWDNLTEKTTNNSGSNRDTKDGEEMCCVQCWKKLIHRPYNSTITRWNESTRQFTDSLQDLQFTETRQDDGGIFDTYTIWVEQPEDKGVLLKDILEPPAQVDERMIVNWESYSLTASYNGAVEWNSVAKKQRTMVKVWQFNSGWQWDRVYSPEWKSVSLSANGGGRGAKTWLYHIPHGKARERTEDDVNKYPILCSQSPDSKHKIIENSVIRKLTPIECERLQTLPDNWTEGISNTQRYKAIWNWWTVDVIKHIFSFIK